MSENQSSSSGGRRWLLAVAAILLVTVVAMGLLLLAEVASRVVVAVVEGRRPSAMAAADAVAGAAWINEYVKESQVADRMEWYPYTYWRRLPYAGLLINVDQDRLRRTWRPDRRAGTPVRVFVLGGSTVWGTGARDDQTIPSHLAQGLVSHGFDPYVVNLGESGYVMRQDLAMLLSRLERGDVPDVAVFYGPYNDVFSAFQNGEAGLSVNEMNRRAEFNASSVDRAGQALFTATAGLRRLSSAGLSLLRGTAGGPSTAIPTDVRQLSLDVASHYCSVRRIVKALSNEYGFRALFYVQPVIFTKPTMTANERRERDRFGGLEDLFARAYGEIRQAATTCTGAPVYDVSGVFAREASAVFIDQVHPNEAGNGRIASEMLKSMAPALSEAAAVPK